MNINNAESENYIQTAPSGFVRKKTLNKISGQGGGEGLTQIVGSNIHHQLTVISLNKAFKVIFQSSPPMPTKKKTTPELHLPRTPRTCKTNQIKLEKTVYRHGCHGNITCLRSAPLADKPGLCVAPPVDGDDKD